MEWFCEKLTFCFASLKLLGKELKKAKREKKNTSEKLASNKREVAALKLRRSGKAQELTQVIKLDEVIRAEPARRRTDTPSAC